MIRVGSLIIVVSVTYLLFGITGIVPLQTEEFAWNNIRLVGGASIIGCLIAAVGYGNE
jgi:cytochrome c oxidase assembly factor CtaG